MKENYNLNDLAQITGFTTRTLRNYLNQGLLKGTKTNSKWQFTPQEIDNFLKQPFIKEGLRIKQSSVVFDFMAVRAKKKECSCIILDIPCSVNEGNKLSGFFCDKVNCSGDVTFNYNWNSGICRIILSGAAASVAKIMKEYYAADFMI